MKNFLSLLAFSIAGLLSTVQAQEFGYGLKAGANIADWEGDAVKLVENLTQLSSVLETQSKYGYHAGGFVNYNLGDLLSLEASLLYSQKGFKVEAVLSDKLPELVKIINPKGSASVTSHYLDLPLVAKVKPIGGLHIYAGPQFSMLMSNKLKVEASLLGFNLIDRTYDIKKGFNSIDVAMVGGIGYEFENGLIISGGYDFGLSSLDEKDRFDAQNRVIKLSLGYQF